MGDPPNFKDARAMGGNPCLEQTLESYELCCLVETFPARNKDFDQFKETLKVSIVPLASCISRLYQRLYSIDKPHPFV